MSALQKFLNYFKRIPQPDLPPALPEGKLRLHLLCGDFETVDAAMAYCFQTDGNSPEQITIDQPGAYIDTGFVEVVYKNAEQRLSEFLPPDEVARTIAKIKGVNTLILITEDAFGGFPYVLGHAPKLYYLGPYVVDV